MNKKHTKLIKDSGPYRVESMIGEFGGLRVRPKHPDYGEDWQQDQKDGHGGGPGLFTRMALAEDVQALLNSVFDPDEVKAWVNDPMSEITYETPDA